MKLEHTLSLCSTTEHTTSLQIFSFLKSLVEKNSILWGDYILYPITSIYHFFKAFYSFHYLPSELKKLIVASLKMIKELFFLSFHLI